MPHLNYLAQKYWKGIFLLFLAFLIASRIPSLLTEPRFWAEEGEIYFAHALTADFWTTLFFTPRDTAGYFLIASTIPVYIAANFVPVEYAPFVTTYFSFAVLLIPLGIILWGTCPLWRNPGQKIIACLIVLFFPYANASGEIWLNTINAQVYCGIIAVIIALENAVDQGSVEKWIRRILLVFVIFSGVYPVIASPLYAIKWYFSRCRESLIQLVIVTVGASVQVLVFLAIRSSGELSEKKLVAFSWAKASLTVLNCHIVQPLLGTRWGNGFLDITGLSGAQNLAAGENEPYAVLAGLVSIIIIVMGFIVILKKQKNVLIYMLAIAFILFATLTAILAMGGVPAGRYSVCSAIILGFLLLGIISGDGFHRPGQKLSFLVLAVPILIGAYEFYSITNPRFTGNVKGGAPDWAGEVSHWRASTDYRLQMWPFPRWRSQLPDPELTANLREVLEKASRKTIMLDSRHPEFKIQVNGLPSKFSFDFQLQKTDPDGLSSLEIVLAGSTRKNKKVTKVFEGYLEQGEMRTIEFNPEDKHRSTGKLRPAETREITFRIRGLDKIGSGAINVSNIEYKSPYSARIFKNID